MAGEGICIGEGPRDIHPRNSQIGTAGNANVGRPFRSNKLNRRKRKGNGLTLPKIPIVKGGKG